jgi:hypothetical protein
MTEKQGVKSDVLEILCMKVDAGDATTPSPRFPVQSFFFLAKKLCRARYIIVQSLKRLKIQKLVLQLKMLSMFAHWSPSSHWSASETTKKRRNLRTRLRLKSARGWEVQRAVAKKLKVLCCGQICCFFAISRFFERQAQNLRNYAAPGAASREALVDMPD